MAGGRPTDYEDGFVIEAQKLAMLGATDMEIADFFDVSVRTLQRWKITRPEFCRALNAGKEEADAKVERSLFQRATGYEQDAVKIFMPAGADKPVFAPYREAVQPDTTACIFWLKNRKPAEWRDKVLNELTGVDGAPIQSEVVVKFVKTGASE